MAKCETTYAAIAMLAIQSKTTTTALMAGRGCCRARYARFSRARPRESRDAAIRRTNISSSSGRTSRRSMKPSLYHLQDRSNRLAERILSAKSSSDEPAGDEDHEPDQGGRSCRSSKQEEGREQPPVEAQPGKALVQNLGPAPRVLNFQIGASHATIQISGTRRPHRKPPVAATGISRTSRSQASGVAGQRMPR